MSPNLIPQLQRLKGWRLRIMVATGTAVATELIVSIMDIILKGHITTDTLLTGLVAVCFVSPSSLQLLEYFLEELTRQEREREAALQKAHAKLLDTQFAMESVGIGIHWIDANTGQFLYVNKFAADLLGYSVDEMLSLCVADIDPDIQTMPQYTLTEIFCQHQHKKFETTHKTKAGHTIPVETTCHFQDAGTDTPARFISFVTDISQRKATELTLLQAKEAAEAANIAKSTFIATMSHELRTPLNAILGFSELLSRDDSISPKQKETLDIINRSGVHLLRMINDVLDISKIEAGHFELDVQAFDLHKLLHDLGDMISVRATNKQLDFRLEISPNIPRYVETDSGKLWQVLTNLLGNAIKFTQRGGVILRAHTQSLHLDSIMILNIEVVDSGIGIPADQQAELFKPFVQLPQVNSDVKGTGLGLAISKSLVELMGGKISVSSVPDVGSIFKIELPVSVASSKAIGVEAEWQIVKSIAPNQPEWRLLIVDDNPENRLLLEIMLTQVGFQVAQANNGQEAIAKFMQWRPHLIWMDMRMPVMDGYEATAKIRQMEGGNLVKIIAVSASVFREQHDSMITAGSDAIIHKPFQAAEVFAALNKYLGVKFIYQDQSAAISSPILELTPEMLVNLPLKLRQQLHEAALNLDTDEADTLIAQVRSLTPDVAEQLQKLAQNYQFEQIIQLIDAANK